MSHPDKCELILPASLYKTTSVQDENARADEINDPAGFVGSALKPISPMVADTAATAWRPARRCGDRIPAANYGHQIAAIVVIHLSSHVEAPGRAAVIGPTQVNLKR